MSSVDLLIVGAGPAGMTAAIAARRHGLEVLVIDEQPAPGGQIWRSVENSRRDDILGPTFVEGRPVAEAFRASGATYTPVTQMWRLDPGFTAYVTRGQEAQAISARAVILATGAQERPAPFPGWTLPGVLTVGAAQIMLKNAGQIPAGDLWIAGSGPLPLLYMTQLLKAGGRIAGYLDTTPPGQWRSALPHLPRALRAYSDLLKGLNWSRKLRASGIRIVRGVSELKATGDGKLETLQYTDAKGATATVPATTLLVHEGVIPSMHAALSLDCESVWNDAQDCYVPTLDAWGESSIDGLFIAGDGAGIAGAKVAVLRGELAALGIAAKLGKLSDAAADDAARPVRRGLKRELAARPFLDAYFRPRASVFVPADETIVCRCEEVTAGQIRATARIGQPGVNQVKSTLRAGMGPCQGRQCAYTVTRLLAAEQRRAPAAVGFIHVRPPLKPVTIGEIASLDVQAER
jgi:NADPH-dependent 2,4-dienoyl-CoA reductase/sulfur reductase-like enzyme